MVLYGVSNVEIIQFNDVTWILRDDCQTTSNHQIATTVSTFNVTLFVLT